MRKLAIFRQYEKVFYSNQDEQRTHFDVVKAEINLKCESILLLDAQHYHET